MYKIVFYEDKRGFSETAEFVKELQQKEDKKDPEDAKERAGKGETLFERLS